MARLLVPLLTHRAQYWDRTLILLRTRCWFHLVSSQWQPQAALIRGLLRLYSQEILLLWRQALLFELAHAERGSISFPPPGNPVFKCVPHCFPSSIRLDLLGSLALRCMEKHLVTMLSSFCRLLNHWLHSPRLRRGLTMLEIGMSRMHCFSSIRLIDTRGKWCSMWNWYAIAYI